MSKYFDVFVTRRVRIRVIADNEADAHNVAHNTDNHVSEEILEETTDEVKPVVS
jgi:hypothetical protein